MPLRPPLAFNADCDAWLREYPWHHFVTFTFRRLVSPWRAEREFRRWVRWMERSAQGPIHFVYAIEPSAGGASAHVHALVAGTGSLKTQVLEAAWKGGHSRVRLYDPSRSGAAYVTKQIKHEDALWDLRLPHRRAA